MLWASSITFVFGFLSSFSPNFGTMLFTRFVTGIGIGGGPVIYAMFLEFVPNGNRGMWCVGTYVRTGGCSFVAGLVVLLLLPLLMVAVAPQLRKDGGPLDPCWSR